MALDKTTDIAIFKERAENLIKAAQAYGLVVTIGLKPLEPLAMGNHEMVAEVVVKHPY